MLVCIYSYLGVRVAAGDRALRRGARCHSRGIPGAGCPGRFGPESLSPSPPGTCGTLPRRIRDRRPRRRSPSRRPSQSHPSWTEKKISLIA